MAVEFFLQILKLIESSTEALVTLFVYLLIQIICIVAFFYFTQSDVSSDQTLNQLQLDSMGIHSLSMSLTEFFFVNIIICFPVYSKQTNVVIVCSYIFYYSTTKRELFSHGSLNLFNCCFDAVDVNKWWACQAFCVLC